MIRKAVFDKILRDFSEGEKAKIYIFGSFARGRQNFTSDIDVGILFEPDGEDSRFKISLLREKFENSNIPQKVDVVNLNDVSEDFKKEVFKDAVLWKID